MNFFVADFETVVEENTTTQERTEVWSWAVSKMFDNTENVVIDNRIESFFEYLRKQGKRSICYFHNLKFDGSFIVDWLLKHGFFVGFDYDSKEFKDKNKLQRNEIIYSITDMGVWYSVVVKYGGAIIEFRDSLKLLPFPVKALSKAFNTKRKKLEIDYKGHSKAGEPITEEEREYISNDVLVVKESLEKFFDFMGYGNNPPLTIASGALKEYKKTISRDDFALWFPNLAEIALDKELHGSSNADEYIRKSYGGGWCYCRESTSLKVQGGENNTIEVFDVNSLYPSVMHSLSGSIYPVGVPVFFKGREGFSRGSTAYYFLRFKCRFELKAGCLPFIQIKNNIYFRRNENLTSSNWDMNGEYIEEPVILTMSETMFSTFKRYYNIYDFEILDGCFFEKERGIFDEYINKFMTMKEEATRNNNPVQRTIAKLFLNSLYGKFGSSPINSFKLAKLDDEGVVRFDIDSGADKDTLFIPVASAITSYARTFTVVSAHKHAEEFLYSDTDSLHLSVKKGVRIDDLPIHDTKLCHWKHEATFEKGYYVRQKTYIEYKAGSYDIKACGLSEKSKKLFEINLKQSAREELTEDEREIIRKASPNEKQFLSKRRTIRDFRQGLSIPSNLEPKTINGGVVLVESYFTIK